MKKILSVITVIILLTQISVYAASGEAYRMEAEELYVLENTAGCYCGIQGKPDGSTGWSGNCQLLWQTANPKQTLKLEFCIDRAGVYSVGAVFTQCVDFATVNIYIDDTLCVEGWDGYAPADTPSEYIDFGSFEFTEDYHTVSIYITGKSDASSGYIVAIDYFEFVRTGSITNAAATAAETTTAEAVNADTSAAESQQSGTEEDTRESDIGGGNSVGIIIGIVAGAATVAVIIVIITQKKKKTA